MTNQPRVWDPVRDLIQMSQAMDRFFEVGTRAGEGRNAKPVYRLPVDAYSTEDAIVIETAIPGVTADDVDIILEKDSLTIRAEVAREEAEGRNYLMRERLYGILERTLTLNVPVDADKVAANFSNGVLTLTLPKAEAAKPRKIAVKSGG